MNGSHDVNARKKELRTHFRAVRGKISPEQKSLWDAAILRHILALPTYQECKTLLCYIPLPDEVDTIPLMKDAWRNGKRVAVPYCLPGGRVIEFYLIESLEGLKSGAYGILEPDPEKHERLDDYTGALCILPGLAYDPDGYRLGYGGGYYDRFLAGDFSGNPTVGVCYGVSTVKCLERGPFDLPCDYLITEEGRIAPTKRKSPV